MIDSLSMGANEVNVCNGNTCLVCYRVSRNCKEFSQVEIELANLVNGACFRITCIEDGGTCGLIIGIGLKGQDVYFCMYAVNYYGEKTGNLQNFYTIPVVKLNTHSSSINTNPAVLPRIRIAD